MFMLFRERWKEETLEVKLFSSNHPKLLLFSWFVKHFPGLLYINMVNGLIMKDIGLHVQQPKIYQLKTF